MSGPTWRPLWLGPPARRLYAAVHPGTPDARVGVLMAPPLLHEQPRSRRVLVDVANRLAAVGVPCLRFDYFGTGDSGGAGEQHDLAEMQRDLDIALDALHAETGVVRVAMLAWRASALPAWSWAQARTDLSALALWEPIGDGAAWLAELEAADRAERLSRYDALRDDVGDTNLMGFPTSPRWRSDIAQVRLADIAPPRSAQVWWLRREGDGAATAPGPLARRTIELPSDAPRFDGGVGVESVAFLSRRLQAVVDELGRAFAALET